MEDEIQQGQAFAEVTGLSFFTYVPVGVSIVVSVICLSYIYRYYTKLKGYGKMITIPNPSWIWASYITSFVVLNIQDGIIRINWVPTV